MEKNRFFKWLWRINAIGLFLLLCAGLFSFLSEQLRRFQNTERTTSPISTLAEDPKGVEKWVLGRVEEVSGTSYMMLPLISEYNKVKAKDKMYYARTNNTAYYHDMVAKNILFINGDKSQSSWLFNTNNQLILEHQILYVEGNRHYYSSSSQESTAKLIYYKILDRDTNGDKIVTTDDKQNFAVSSISGKGYKIIVENIERIISVSYSKNNEMHLLYQKEGMGYLLRLNIESLEIISNGALPKVGA